MDPREKLDEIISLHSVINSSWLRIDWLEEALAEMTQALQEAEDKHQEKLMNELGKWAVLEGVAGVDDHLPMLRPVEFGITMLNLLARRDATEDNLEEEH